MKVPAPRTVRLSCVIALILITNNRSFAQNYTWSSMSGGSWVNGTNWGEAPGDFPSGSSDRATFSSAGNGSAKIVTLDVAITLRRLNFSADQTGSITLAPLLLVTGYCALIPYAILARDEKPGSGSDRRSGPPEGA